MTIPELSSPSPVDGSTERIVSGYWGRSPYWKRSSVQ
jgi:hypothetical protein